MLVCSRLGAVFVPLNWRLAAPELAAIARHAGLSALLHGPELAGLLAQAGAQIDLTGPAVPARPGDRLLVYASGTTGSLKGAMHTQAGMTANLDLAIAVQGLTAADRVLAVLRMVHVGGLCILVLPTLAGAALWQEARFDAADWLQDVATWRPSTSLQVPAVMQALLAQAGWLAADHPRFSASGSGG